MKNIQKKKDRPSIFITHHAIYDVKYYLFGIRTRRKVSVNQPKTGEVQVRKKKVTSETKLSSKWKMFLQDTTNKESYFLF